MIHNWWFYKSHYSFINDPIAKLKRGKCECPFNSALSEFGEWWITNESYIINSIPLTSLLFIISKGKREGEAGDQDFAIANYVGN